MPAARMPGFKRVPAVCLIYTAPGKFEAVGQAMLEAAMRCFDASRFGNEIHVDPKGV